MTKTLHSATLEEAEQTEARPYRPHGASAALLSNATGRANEIVLSGPAGTGKTRACLEKICACASRFSDMRALIVRKTRASLTESALVTLEDHVLPSASPALLGAGRASRRAYTFPNGASIVVGGMDRATRIMSTEYDLIYVQEAIELLEPEWEALTTRLRNAKMPWQQLIADTNPDRPSHWLKKRAEAGKTLMLESRHEDNPTLWDAAVGDWTERGRDYIAKLDALTGPRRLRLRYGRWVQAEGVVYDGWDAKVHVIDRPEKIPLEWDRYWAIDFGYTNPFVCQWWARDPDGRLFLYREIYRTQRLVEDHARQMLELSKGEPRPKAVICDHDAEDRATLKKHLGLETVAATKEVSPGIQAVASRLRPAGDGKPRLFVYRDSLVERDAALVEAKRPLGIVEEFDAYIWQEGPSGPKEEPVKENDHAMDCCRYLVAFFDLKQKKRLKAW